MTTTVNSSVADRLKALRDRFDLTQEQLAKELGSDRSYLSQIENGRKEPGPKFLARLDLVEKEGVFMVKGRLRVGDSDILRDRPLPVQYIPRISWAHAGELSSYEELPSDWQDGVANTSTDPKAFALTIKGSCMSPDFAREGDDVIVTPSAPIHDGCLVVARLHDGSVLFRRYNITKPNGKAFRLTCSNKDYGQPIDLTWKDVMWVYRVPSAVRNFD